MTTQDAGQVVVYRVSATEVDALTVDGLAGEVQKLLAALPPDATTVVLDCREIRFIDSSGIAVLIRLKARLESRGAQLEVHRPGAMMRRSIEVLGLTDRLGVKT